MSNLLPTPTDELQTWGSPAGTRWLIQPARASLTAEQQALVASNAAAAAAMKEQVARDRAARMGMNIPAIPALSPLSTAAPTAPARPAPAAPAPTPPAALSPEQQWERAWSTDNALRAEFLDNFASYQAYMRAEASGQAKIWGGARLGQPVAQRPAPEPQLDRAAQKGGTLEERCIARWKADPTIEEEFGALSTYVAFTRADEAGLVKIYGKRG